MASNLSIDPNVSSDFQAKKNERKPKQPRPIRKIDAKVRVCIICRNESPIPLILNRKLCDYCWKFVQSYNKAQLFHPTFTEQPTPPNVYKINEVARICIGCQKENPIPFIINQRLCSPCWWLKQLLMNKISEERTPSNSTISNKIPNKRPRLEKPSESSNFVVALNCNESLPKV